MIYTAKAADMAMRSYWKCAQNADGSWYVSSSPTTDTKTVTFPAALPEGATVVSSRVTAEFGSPNSGTAVLTINGVSPDENGSVSIDGNVARFTFRANGRVYEDTKQHYGVLMVRNITLTVEYTEGEVPETPRPERIVGKSRLPRLLDASMREKGRLHPESLSLTLNLAPLSLAEMQIPNTDMHVGPRDFVELFTPTGSAGIFRVYAIDENAGMSRTVYLKHGLTTLADAMQPGKGKMDGSMRTLLTSLLANQVNPVRWEIGTVEVPDDQDLTWEYNDSNVLKSLIDVMKELPAYRLEYDQSSLPWILHVKKMDDTPTCEGRLRRNLKTLMISRDDTDMVTRLYIPGVDDPLDADTVETWGVIARKLDIDKKLDKEDKLSEANRMLEQKKKPLISIQVSAFALAAATGEPLDDFVVGKMCRLALPDLDMTVNERIVSVKYNDIVQDPENVDLELKNKAESTESDIAGLVVDTRAVKKSVDDMLGYIYDFNDMFSEVVLKAEYEDDKLSYLELYADAEKSIANLRAEHEAKIAALELYVDDELAKAVLKADYEADKKAQLELIANANESIANLRAEYEDKMAALELYVSDELAKAVLKADYEADKKAQLELIATATESIATLKAEHDGKIAALELKTTDLESSVVLKSTYDENRTADLQLIANANESIARLTATHGDKIAALEAKATEQGTQITAKADNVTVEAIQTEIKGLLKVENLQSEIANLSILSNGSIQSDYVDTTDMVAQHASVTGSLAAGSVTIGGAVCGLYNLTIGEKSFPFYSTGDATFDWSDIQEVQDALDAARTEGASSVTLTGAGWQGGSYTVNASNGQSHKVNLPTFSVSGGDSFNAEHKTTVYFSTGTVPAPLKSKEVDATSVYDAGYAAGYKAAKDAVKVTAGISQDGFPAQYYAKFKYWGKATIDGEEVGSASGSKSFNVKGAM